MNPNSLGKKIFVLTFLLIILVGIFIWQGNSLGQGYFDWLKTGVLRANPFKTNISPEIKLSKDSGLDLSSVNLEEIIAEKTEQEQPASAESSGEAKEEIIGIGGPEPSKELEQEIVVVQDQMTLEEIQQEVNRIAQEVERIEGQVQELIALSEEKINE